MRMRDPCAAVKPVLPAGSPGLLQHASWRGTLGKRDSGPLLARRDTLCAPGNVIGKHRSVGIEARAGGGMLVGPGMLPACCSNQARKELELQHDSRIWLNIPTIRGSVRGDLAMQLV